MGEVVGKDRYEEAGNDDGVKREPSGNLCVELVSPAGEVGESMVAMLAPTRPRKTGPREARSRENRGDDWSVDNVSMNGERTEDGESRRVLDGLRRPRLVPVAHLGVARSVRWQRTDVYRQAMSEELVDTFYRAFADRDADAMVTCYHDAVVFEDPVFGELDAGEARSMWAMLCSSDTDLSVRHTTLSVDSTTAKVNWIADYTFTSTGRSVTNDVTATLKFADGKIIDHRDGFSFWKWSSQALGMPGKLLGWSPLITSKVRSTARANLDAYRQRNPES